MKKFLYFESEEGGMSVHDIRTPDDLAVLYAWMRPLCKRTDEALVRWMAKATAGDYKHHRLGTLVCVSDKGVKR